MTASLQLRGLAGLLLLAAAPATAAEYSSKGTEPARRPTLVVLTPGMKVTGPQSLPPGWSHLIVKSMPRLASGELDSLPSVAQNTATLFHATLLADVRPSAGAGSPFVLSRLGIGLCTPVNGTDTVISSTALKHLRVPLTFVGRKVLAGAEQEMMRGRVKARTPTFVLYSAPSVKKARTGHEAILLRYALLVDPRTGALQTVLWSQPRESKVRTAPDRLFLLNPSLVHDAALDVLAERVLNAVPVNWSFALVSLPPGKPLTPTPALRQWCVRDTLAPNEAVALEAELRKLVVAANEER